MLPTKKFKVNAVAKIMMTTVDSIRRHAIESKLEVDRQDNGPKTRLYSIQNIFDLADWRAKFKGFKTKRQVVATVYAPKGGVGKTTIAANLAATFQILGAKVLIIDLDFQSNLTLAFGYDAELTAKEAAAEGVPEEQVVQYHFGHLMPEWPGGAVPLDKVIKKPYGENGPHLIPSDLTLDRLDTLLTFETMEGKSADIKIGKLIAEGKSGKNPDFDLSQYDVILFDAAPAKNRMTRGALMASDFVITPVSMEKFSTKALSYLSQVLGDMKEQFHRAPELIIVGNFFDQTRVRVVATLMEITASYTNAWLDRTIRRSESIPKLLTGDENLPVSLALAKDDAAADMRAVSISLLSRMGVTD